MNFKLKIWRQANTTSQGKLVEYSIENISANTSFLEMIDILNAVSYTHLTLPTSDLV